MRPRKLVLVIDLDEERLGLTRFLLENRGYRVVAEDAVGVVVKIEFDGDLIWVTSSRGTLDLLTNPKPVELLEAVRLAALQKRGPKTKKGVKL
jgi:hypothetical protein